MSFLKSLFGLGGGEKDSNGTTVDGMEDYKGYTIKAALMSSGSEHQLAGTIEKDVDGELKISRFIRADTFPSKDDAVAATLAKGRQIVDEQGDGLFD